MDPFYIYVVSTGTQLLGISTHYGHFRTVYTKRDESIHEHDKVLFCNVLLIDGDDSRPFTRHFDDVSMRYSTLFLAVKPSTMFLR